MGNIEYYPEEIAETLCGLAYEYPEEKVVKDCEDAIAYIKTIAENPYNNEYFRTFYKVLDKMCSVQ